MFSSAKRHRKFAAVFILALSAGRAGADVVLDTDGLGPRRQVSYGILEPSTSDSNVSLTTGPLTQFVEGGTFNLPPGSSGLHGSAYQDTSIGVSHTLVQTQLAVTGFGAAVTKANGAAAATEAKFADAQAGMTTGFHITNSPALYSISVDLRNFYHPDRNGGPAQFGKASIELFSYDTQSVVATFDTDDDPTPDAMDQSFVAAGVLLPGHYSFNVFAHNRSTSSILIPASGGPQQLTTGYFDLDFSVTQAVPEPTAATVLSLSTLMLLQRRRR